MCDHFPVTLGRDSAGLEGHIYMHVDTKIIYRKLIDFAGLIFIISGIRWTAAVPPHFMPIFKF
jgi:hypothetical protein